MVVIPGWNSIVRVTHFTLKINSHRGMLLLGSNHFIFYSVNDSKDRQWNFYVIGSLYCRSFVFGNLTLLVIQFVCYCVGDIFLNTRCLSNQ